MNDRNKGLWEGAGNFVHARSAEKNHITKVHKICSSQMILMSDLSVIYEASSKLRMKGPCRSWRPAEPWIRV